MNIKYTYKAFDKFLQHPSCEEELVEAYRIADRNAYANLGQEYVIYIDADGNINVNRNCDILSFSNIEVLDRLYSDCDIQSYGYADFDDYWETDGRDEYVATVGMHMEEIERCQEYRKDLAKAEEELSND